MSALVRARRAVRQLGGGPVEWSAARDGLLATLVRRGPRLEPETGPTVRGWVLRLALGCLAVGLLAAPLRPGDGWALGAGHPPAALVFVAVVLVLLGWPGGAAAAVVLGLIAVRVLSGDLLGVPAALGLVLGVHLLLTLSALCGHAPVTSRVEVGVLADAGRLLLRGQALALPLTALAVLVAGIGTEPSGRDWLRVAAVLAVLAVTVLLVRRAGGPLRR